MLSGLTLRLCASGCLNWEGEATAVNMIELTKQRGRMAAKERKGRKNRGFSATGRPLEVMTERLAVSGTSHGSGFLPILFAFFAFFCGHPPPRRLLKPPVELSRVPRRLAFASLLAKVATGVVNIFTAVASPSLPPGSRSPVSRSRVKPHYFGGRQRSTRRRNRQIDSRRGWGMLISEPTTLRSLG